MRVTNDCASEHDKNPFDSGSGSDRATESLELAFREQEDDLTKRLMTKQDGADIKAEIIKWMFLFWLGQIAVLIAAAKLFFGA